MFSLYYRLFISTRSAFVVLTLPSGLLTSIKQTNLKCISFFHKPPEILSIKGFSFKSSLLLKGMGIQNVIKVKDEITMLYYNSFCLVPLNIV